MPADYETQMSELISGLSSMGHAIASYLLEDDIARHAFFQWMKDNSDTFEANHSDELIPDLQEAQKAFGLLYESAERRISKEPDITVMVYRWSPNLSSSRSLSA